MNIQGLTRLSQDTCYRELEQITIQKMGQYKTRNHRKPLCQDPSILETSLRQPVIIHKDGYGWTSKKGCNIDCDSKLRNARNLTNVRNINQLTPRLHSTIPYMGRGWRDIQTESILLPGNSTYQSRPCNSLSGVYIDRFTPQIPHIKNNIQNTKYIIPEESDKKWIRGGQPSRQFIK